VIVVLAGGAPAAGKHHMLCSLLTPVVMLCRLKVEVLLNAISLAFCCIQVQTVAGAAAD
jgi:hypothetical protein